MPTDNHKRLTPLESVIMDSVWQMSQVTVRQVREHLHPVRPMAYNTVLTVMRILRDKGFLRTERRGRVDVYRPTITREQAAQGPLRELLNRFFAGSARALVSELLNTEGLNAEEIRGIRHEVDMKLQGGSKRGDR